MKEFNKRNLKEIQSKYEADCMAFLQDQPKYENCMKGLEQNDYFVCQQYVEENNKFSKCMKELRTKRIRKVKIKRKLQ